MAATKRRKRMTMTKNDRVWTLEIRNLPRNTTASALLRFFAQRGFHVVRLTIDMFCVGKYGVPQAYVALPKNEAKNARDWARAQIWKGKEYYTDVREAYYGIGFDV